MTDVIVHEDEEVEDETLAEAASAAGAAEVHEDSAEQAAMEAELAAGVATEAASANVAAVEEIAESAALAEQAAVSAGLAESAVIEALQAQTIAISSLVEELKAAREQPAVVVSEKKTRKSPDRPPTEKKKGFGHRYYGLK